MFNKSPYKVPPEIMKQKLSEKEPKKETVPTYQKHFNFPNE